jgi:anti-anti-sigma factor
MVFNFSYSDTIAGYVTHYDVATQKFGLQTSDERKFLVNLTNNTYAELIRNLGEAYVDASSFLQEMLSPGRYLSAYGTFYPDTETFEAKHIVFLGRKESEYLFEKPDWWLKQIRSLADFYLQSQFGDDPVDFRNYRTDLNLYGAKTGGLRQETDTISRMVYGFATAYLLTGEDRYLEVAERGTEYLREHMRYLDLDEGICYWYHAIDPKGLHEQKIFASEFGDDYEAIPAYEQIYALCGPTQTFRITGDPLIQSDIEMTVNLFEKYFLDQDEHGGYFSHIDPVTLDPRSKTLGRNQSRKNWNSVGDHAPAYLINLWLATGEQRYADMLVYTGDLIAKHFPDPEHSPFVQERFHEDWSHDQGWGWQQDRAVVGHNLKIAWNLMRISHLKPNDAYTTLARSIAAEMPSVGSDQQRGGWYDVVERQKGEGERYHRFVWHDRKAWWQQEQAILAYLILAGSLKEPEHLRLARESASFYNTWFLDQDSGGIYFNVLANGLPYLLGTERNKGSHSMSGYHSFELAYLSAIYTNLLITGQPMTLHFKPQPGAFKDRILRVQPDILPPGSVTISEVWINDQKYTDFDPQALTVQLPDTQESLRVKVRVSPSDLSFDATFLEVHLGTARIQLSGSLNNSSLPLWEAELDKALEHHLDRLVLLMNDLDCMSGSVVRALILAQQKLGPNVDICVLGPKEQILDVLKRTNFAQRVVILNTYDEITT